MFSPDTVRSGASVEKIVSVGGPAFCLALGNVFLFLCILTPIGGKSSVGLFENLLDASLFISLICSSMFNDEILLFARVRL